MAVVTATQIIVVVAVCYKIWKWSAADAVEAVVKVCGDDLYWWLLWLVVICGFQQPITQTIVLVAVCYIYGGGLWQMLLKRLSVVMICIGGCRGWLLHVDSDNLLLR